MVIEVVDFRKLAKSGLVGEDDTLNGIPVKVGKETGLRWVHLSIEILGLELSLELALRKLGNG